MLAKGTFLVGLALAQNDLVDLPAAQCGHYHTKCIAPGVETHEDYTLYSYPLSVSVWEVFDQLRDLTFAAFYNAILQKKIDEFIEGGMTREQAKAQMAALQNNPTINATLTQSALAISVDGHKMHNHGCWCAKSNPNIGRKTGGRVTDIVDYMCKKYIERQECLSLKGGACEDYTLVRNADPSEWILRSPEGAELHQYWAKVWVGPNFIIPEQAVYIEDNSDPCLKEKAKPAYEFVNQMYPILRGGFSEEGSARMYQALNPLQTNWDGWKPDAYCGEENDNTNRVLRKKKCVGYSPHVYAVWDEED